ncbi:MAG: XisI protein [Crocosphaera sp.]|nr:XisI protein [Crocosphaera sp.]
MAKLEQYREAIKKLLYQYASYKYPYGNIENQVIFDGEHDHYQLVRVGWEDKKRIYGCSIHLDIKDEKIWIQCNSTDIDIAQELVNLGVDKQDIVLGFQPLYMRQYTDYAVS